MFNLYPHYQDNKKPDVSKVIKIYSWLAYDVSVVGMIVYTWLNIHLGNIETFIEGFEKFMLFLCTIIFAGYRIYILHLDAEKKKIENNSLRKELEEKWKPKNGAA